MSVGFEHVEALKESIAKWCVRVGDTEFEAQTPEFIRLAELRIERELDWPMHERETTGGTMTAGNSRLILPAGDDYSHFSYPLQLAITAPPITTLETAALAKLEDLRGSGSPGRPTHFALVGTLFGLTVQLAPTPDANYPYLLRWMGGIPKLGEGVFQTNWLLQQGPDAYLYGSLLHAAAYIQDDTRVPLWEGFFRDAVRSLKRIAVRQRTGGGRLRVQPDRWA